MPSIATDPRQLAADLRERINPDYADQIGTESYERRLCAEAIEILLKEVETERALSFRNQVASLEVERNTKNVRIAELESALNTLRDRVQDEYDRIYISGVLGK